MLVLPDALVMRLRIHQDLIDVGRISLDQLLDVLLYGQRAVHVLERLVGPWWKVLYRLFGTS